MKTRLIFFAAIFTVTTFTLFAQAPPPPPASSNEGGNGPVGNGAPIDGGLAGALVVVAGFGAWKLLKALQQKRISG
ncbi:MAG: hypothetical protein ACOYNC_16200 [Bacteroidales bacterium]